MFFCKLKRANRYTNPNVSNQQLRWNEKQISFPQLAGAICVSISMYICSHTNTHQHVCVFVSQQFRAYE